MARPACGGSQLVSGAPSFWATVLAVVGVISIIVGVATKVTGIVEGITGFVIAAAKVLGIYASANGALAIAAIIAVALTTAVLISWWAWDSYKRLCDPPPFGKFACVSGVINAITPGFSQWYSELVGFAGNQPQIDVVVKSDYWPIVALNNPNPPFVWCAGCANCPPAVAGPAASAGGTPGCSPELPCFYHNRQVCQAAFGSAIGATVGAALGAVGATIAAVAAMGALGCSIGGPFAWICWIILAVVLIVVILIVVVAALIGSVLGTQAGKASAGGGSAPTTSSGTVLAAGAYVSVLGNLVQVGSAMGANALWFAGWIPNTNGTTVDDATATNNSGTTVLGTSVGMAPFCYTDPDTNIPASVDICPVP